MLDNTDKFNKLSATGLYIIKGGPADSRGFSNQTALTSNPPPVMLSRPPAGIHWPLGHSLYASENLSSFTASELETTPPTRFLM